MIGQNSFTETEDSPLTAGADGGILTPDPEVERERIEALEQWKAERDEDAVDAALAELAAVAADDGENIMPATIAAAKAGATTGEWAEVLREVFGAYRGPTGVGGAAPAADREQLDAIRARVDEISERIGHRIKILVGKPGLDGHSNGAEQIALRARDVGMEVIYQGIRLTPDEIAESALQEDVDVVGLSILSGSHLELIPEVVRLLRDEGVDVPVVVGGIIPPADAERLREAGVAGVYTPKDFDINRIMGEIVELVGERAGSGAPPERGGSRRAAPARQWSDERAERGPLGLAALLPLLVAEPRDPDPLRRDPPRRPRHRGASPKGVDEVQESVVQCLDCMHDQPHLTFQDDRVVPIEDRWERMVAGTPWVASCTVTRRPGPGRDLLGPGGDRVPHLRRLRRRRRARVLHPRPLPQARRRADRRPPAGRALRPLGRRRRREVLEEAAHGQLEITSLAEESRPPAHASDEAH